MEVTLIKFGIDFWLNEEDSEDLVYLLENDVYSRLEELADELEVELLKFAKYKEDGEEDCIFDRTPCYGFYLSSNKSFSVEDCIRIDGSDYRIVICDNNIILNDPKKLKNIKLDITCLEELEKYLHKEFPEYSVLRKI